jgi:hypothetical protein
VFHPHHGNGTVTGHAGGRAAVKFDGGPEHSFEVTPGGSPASLQPRDAGEAAGHRAADAVATRGAASVGAMLGGSSALKSVRTVPVKGNESILASMGWDGVMHVRQDVADGLASGEEEPGAVIANIRPYATILHELIHSVGYAEPGTPEQQRQVDAYQNPHVAAIEEGFTELGTIQHAADFFDAIGVGARPTEVLSGKAEDARGNLPHATMREYAQHLAEPERIASGDAWNHYTGAEMAAYDWTRRVADAEAATRKAGAAALRRREQELADEINRAGPADKPLIMAQQAIRATGGQPRPGMNMDAFASALAGVLGRRWTTGNLDRSGDASTAWYAVLQSIEEER